MLDSGTILCQSMMHGQFSEHVVFCL